MKLIVTFLLLATLAVCLAEPVPDPGVTNAEPVKESREARASRLVYSNYYPYPYYGYGVRYGYGYPFDQAYENGYYGSRNVYYTNPGRVVYVDQ